MAAIRDPDDFAAGAAALLAGGVDRSVEPGRSRSPAELLAWWRDGRAALLDALGPLDPRARVPWYGPPMSARSFATARLMETWAHGQDVADALGVERRPTGRLRHVAHIGVRARPFSYAIHGLPLPAEPVAVVLVGPDGDTWSWDEGAEDVVTGPALDFCLVVTQRRHPPTSTCRSSGIGPASGSASPRPSPGRPVPAGRRLGSASIGARGR